MVKQRHRNNPNTPTRCGLMMQNPLGTGTSSNRSLPSTGTGLNVSILATIRATMMTSWTRCSGAGIPTRWAISNTAVSIVGKGKHLVAMSCKSSLCLRCAKVYVDNWVSQVSKMLHDGVIYRHIVLTVPDRLKNTVLSARRSVAQSLHAVWRAVPG